jgi:hypothetical protein
MRSVYQYELVGGCKGKTTRNSGINAAVCAAVCQKGQRPEASEEGAGGWRGSQGALDIEGRGVSNPPRQWSARAP